MAKFYCDYCQVYLTHDSQSGRRQHNRGRKHQDSVKAYYIHFLKTHKQVDKRSRTFALVPEGAGELPSMATGDGKQIALGVGGPMAGIFAGDVPLVQPSTIPPVRDGELLRDEKALEYLKTLKDGLVKSMTAASVPSPQIPMPPLPLFALPSPTGAPMLPMPPVPGSLPRPPPPTAGRSLPMPPLPMPRPPPPPPKAVTQTLG